MEALSTIDSDLFLFLNGLHVDWLDKVMTLLTDMWIWLPLYLLLIYWTVKQYGKRCWWVFLVVGLVVLCSDQISSHLFKPCSIGCGLVSTRILRESSISQKDWRAGGLASLLLMPPILLL